MGKSFSGEIKFFGGVGGLVTGSCYRIDIGPSSFVLDCGLCQGKFEERSDRGERRNFLKIGEIAHGVTQFVLSHCHIDHSGLLARVYGHGFTPKTFVTPGTEAFLPDMLYNSAQIQERQDPQNRLYDTFDVDKTLRYLVVTDPYAEFPIGQRGSGLTGQLLPNGHITGSNSVFFRNRGTRQNIFFTGDMGKPNQPLCGGYLDQVSHYPNDPIHVLVAESTNFQKEPVSSKEAQINFFRTITDVWHHGGTPVVPSLSLHRLQLLLEMTNNGLGSLIPNDTLVIVDAPLGMKLTEIFKTLGPDQLTRRFGDDPNYYKTEEARTGRFDIEGMIRVSSHEESLALAEKYASYQGPVLIFASGGMFEHGRVINWWKGSFSKNPKNAFLLTCHQVDGTHGATLLHQEHNLNGKKRDRARIIQVPGFTSHISGPTETFGFLERLNLDDLQKVIITHGKDSARVAMANEFMRRGYPKNIVLPALYETVQL